MLFIGALILYAITASRGAQWQDSGRFILRMLQRQLHDPLGLALCHPLHHWLGRAAIRVWTGEPALATTLVSSIAAAIAVANIYGCSRLLTGRHGPALFAALSFMLAHSVWQLATLTESYTLTVALLTTEWWCLCAFARYGRRTAMWGMCLANGLGVANHLQAALTTPVVLLIAIWGRKRHDITWGSMIIGAWLWLFGSLPYTSLVMEELLRTGDLAGTLRSTLFGNSWSGDVLNTAPSARTLAVFCAYPLLNFPNLLLPAAVYGLVRCRRTRVTPATRLALVGALVIHAVFVSRYSVVDQFNFFLPLYALLAIFGGIGARQALRLRTRRFNALRDAAIVLLITTPLVYALVATLARATGALDQVVRNKPYRDDYVYLLIPWSIADRSAEQLGEHAVALAGDEGLIVIEDEMASFAVVYELLVSGRSADQAAVVPPRNREEQRRTLDERVRTTLAREETVVLVPLNRDEPAYTPSIGSWERQGDLYVLSSAD